MELILRGVAYAAVLIVVIAILLFLVGMVLVALERRVIPNRYEWLSVLSHYEWKGTIQIREEMRKLKKTKAMMSIMYTDLDHLEEEGLAEGRRVVRRIAALSLSKSPDKKIIGLREYIIASMEYRLTPSGTGKKNKILREEQESVLPEDVRIA